MVTSATGVTVRLAALDTAPEVATIDTIPVATEEASPAVLGAMLTVAILASDDVHCTVRVMSCVLASANVPTALNCSVVPSGMETDSGDTAMEINIVAVT